MAKPFVLAPPGPSNFPAQAFVPPTESTRHRSHPRPRSQAAPSLSILSLLATLASSSTVHGSPTPPSFLCPSLESGDIAECNVAKRAPTQVSRPPHTFDPRHTHAPRNVPDRFSKQADGAWRRVGSYTLYGSTMPACSSVSLVPFPSGAGSHHNSSLAQLRQPSYLPWMTKYRSATPLIRRRQARSSAPPFQPTCRQDGNRSKNTTERPSSCLFLSFWHYS